MALGEAKENPENSEHWPCKAGWFGACFLYEKSVPERTHMQRRQAKAIAIAQQQVIKTRLAIAAGLLLLPALLLLLISP